MENLLRSLEANVKALFTCDPAVLRVSIIDTNGMEIVALSKTHYSGHKDALPPMLNQMLKFCDQFLGFMKMRSQESFIFTWNFETINIFAANSPYGSMIVYCERSVNPGLMKKILKNAINNFRIIMAPVFQ